MRWLASVAYLTMSACSLFVRSPPAPQTTDDCPNYVAPIVDSVLALGIAAAGIAVIANPPTDCSENGGCGDQKLLGGTIVAGAAVVAVSAVFGFHETHACLSRVPAVTIHP
jgi:hypothetical protein